ncbi:zinc finger protein 488 [Hoplias malabaricus]|uniref:zinc finger protein 488 n=1 Tax=Hoplias malabaricus TaxID=27720 RepID=UPI003461AC57
MEPIFTSRSLWTNDSKFLHHHHHSTDLFTSVQVTQDIPAGVTFGPCLLHSTFYDTIAFIALKAFDKREKSYVFRVDPEAMRSSVTVPWLRLVQAAMDRAEQNTEAFLKGGQLFFRTTRSVRRGEELFVWYDEELSHLLGLSDIKPRAAVDGLSCGRCGQTFRNENPFLAHCRFLCVQVKVAVEQKRQCRVTTDFHNIARDLEHLEQKKAEDVLTSRKRKHDESLSPMSRKPVLLEKTNIDLNNPSHVHKDYTQGPCTAETADKRAGLSDPAPEIKTGKNSAFAEMKKETVSKREQHSLSVDIRRQNHSTSANNADAEAHQSDSSAFSFVLPGSAHTQQKSAFFKPHKRTVSPTEVLQNPGPLLHNSHELLDDAKSSVCYRNLLASHLFQNDPQTMTATPLLYTPEQWSGGLSGQLSTSVSGQLRTASSLTLLPATISSLQGVSAQNWCAKCNLSFRMTSDLVLHMRSHHKKEFAAESQARRRREDKLTCPICHEYFRERHHLSRHMTSHN